MIDAHVTHAHVAQTACLRVPSSPTVQRPPPNSPSQLQNGPKSKTPNPNQKSEIKNQKSVKLPWPKFLPDRAKAIESILHSIDHIRSLRPTYQLPLFQKPCNADSLSASSRLPYGATPPNSPSQLQNGPKSKTPNPNQKSKIKNQKSGNLPWPKSLPDRAIAIESILHSTDNPITTAAIALHFLKPRYDNVPEIHEFLETLCTFGRAHPGKKKAPMQSKFALSSA